MTPCYYYLVQSLHDRIDYVYIGISKKRGKIYGSIQGSYVPLGATETCNR